MGLCTHFGGPIGPKKPAEAFVRDPFEMNCRRVSASVLVCHVLPVPCSDTENQRVQYKAELTHIDITDN